MKGFAMLKIGATGWIEKEIPKCGPIFYGCFFCLLQRERSI